MRLGETKVIRTETLTETTLKNLIVVAREQRADPLVRETAQNIVTAVKEKDFTGEINALFDYVRQYMRYTQDVNGIEYVKTPVRHLTEIIEKGSSFGDCDDISLLLSTLLQSAGYRTRFVIIVTPGNATGCYDHIYVEAKNPLTGKWVCLDATMKEKPYGWCPGRKAEKVYPV